MYIRNKQDLKFAYGMLRFAQLRGLDDVAKEMKEGIRRFQQKPAREDRIVKDNGIDGYIRLSPLPACIETAEEANEYFMECEYCECIPTPYDCSGQAFTSWYKIFRRGGRFWVYHAICFDV